MRNRRLALLLPLLLLAGCLGYEANPKEMLLRTGDTATVKIVEKHWFAGSITDISPGDVRSSDTTVATVEGNPGGQNFVVRAWHPGTAYLVSGYPETNIATIHVIECPQGKLTPVSAAVATRVGVAVKLRVNVSGLDETQVGWYEERASGWVPTPFATGSTYDFTPRATGTYRVQARYDDVCGEATATFTITATARIRAAAH